MIIITYKHELINTNFIGYIRMDSFFLEPANIYNTESLWRLTAVMCDGTNVILGHYPTAELAQSEREIIYEGWRNGESKCSIIEGMCVSECAENYFGYKGSKDGDT